MNDRVVICIPSHCSPEPWNPSLHVHVNDPTVLAHFALSSQLSVPLSHSLISENDNHRALLFAVVSLNHICTVGYNDGRGAIKDNSSSTKHHRQELRKHIKNKKV